MDRISHPFQNNGIDYVGPFEVKFQKTPLKYWSSLFTCLTTRAVHIEEIERSDTHACMIALSRFMSRRGRPQTVIRDYGTNFVGTARDFRETNHQGNPNLIYEALAHIRVVWKFNPPGAPYFGSVGERLV